MYLIICQADDLPICCPLYQMVFDIHLHALTRHLRGRSPPVRTCESIERHRCAALPLSLHCYFQLLQISAVIAFDQFHPHAGCGCEPGSNGRWYELLD